ncbi:MAG: zinc ABC transporter substrate-binding protein [Acholeplasmataceae bacterium]|nr:zinc ABC transporter substrate-binding protein [Acholeplasmataceae bacterium]
MKKFASFIFIIVTLILLASCTNSKKADIVTTLFPQYDFARQIVGDKMTVSLLIPPGAEIHDYEATSRDMVAIKESKLFIFTSLEIDTWIKDETKIGGENTIVLNLSTAYELMEHDHHDDHVGHTSKLSTVLGEDDDHDDDIHFWTDPTTAVQLIEAILEKIIEIDPENRAYYEANAHAYIAIIEEIHHELSEYLEDYEDSTIYFAGHNAMESFAERYHLNIVSLFTDFKPDADLTSAELISFVNAVKAANTNYLFIEELVEPKAANKIKNELAKDNIVLNLLVLHGFHNVTKTEMENGVTYSSLLQMNFDHLKIALGGASV